MVNAKLPTFDLLGNVEHLQDPLYATLIGFRQTMARHLGLRAMPLVTHNNAKATLRRDFKEYPFGYFKITSMTFKKDEVLVKSVGRHGAGVSLNEAANAIVSKAYLVPVAVSIEMHVIHNDVRDMFHFTSKLGMLTAMDKFSFRVELVPDIHFVVGVFSDSDSILIPEVDLENESDPGAFDLSYSFRVDTKIGIVKAVPKINNEGRVTSSVQPGSAPDYDE